MNTIRAKCGFTVIEGNEDLIKNHEHYCPICNDPEKLREALIEQRKLKKQRGIDNG